MSKVLVTIKGRNVTEHSDGSVHWIGQFTIDADGSPRAYHPKGSPPGLDYLANAGYPGNWWGIAVGSNGRPIIQGANDPAPGFYVSTTAYKNPGYRHGDPRRELNSEEVPFIVVPPQIIKAVKPVVLGCKAMVVNTKTGASAFAGCGDVGPRNHLGEGSIFLARKIGLSGDPKSGGSLSYQFHFIIWPGVAADGLRLQPSGGRRAAATMLAAGDVEYD